MTNEHDAAEENVALAAFVDYRQAHPHPHEKGKSALSGLRQAARELRGDFRYAETLDAVEQAIGCLEAAIAEPIPSEEGAQDA